MAGNIVTDRIQTDTSYASSLAIETNGAERLRIDSSGRVGIGTTSPNTNSKLDVAGISQSSNATYPAFQLYNSGLASNAYFRIAYDAANNLVFNSVNNAYNTTTEYMRIDSSGNVGIGTVSPSTYGKFAVVSSTAGAAKISIQDTSGGSASSLIQFGINDTSGFNTADAARIWTTAASSTVASLNFAAYSGGAPSTAQMTLTGGNVGIGTTVQLANSLLSVNQGITARTAALSGVTPYLQMYNGNAGTDLKIWRIGGGSSGQLSIETVNDAYSSATARVTIDSSGNLQLGSTSPPEPGRLFVSSTSVSAVPFVLQQTAAGSTVANSVVFYRNSTSTGTIQVTGTTTAYNTSSDYRLKENVTPMTGALAKVIALKPCTYTWKFDGSFGEGFIAHELAEVVPQAVGGDKDAVDANGKIIPQGIDTSFLVATLTAAIQEQQALITALTARIEALENK
jgi:Chaperone of endosialidase